ncbi:MAG TPA: hypothetical protein PLE16_12360 [Spirochaetota bacterium]|jgi:hypothetical protein|nr:hypothetical protein [Spirochaetota bacterium]HOH35984.1 hypothetical protein [Spirochaetota bacterium]HPJ13438.1 hypothetical protein [Spirochaetota bacterium]HPM35376.1 hypothetical protein [Spirochaetota bacterium]HPW50927.1 hypothetical protein [Spirochaetota bacterium]
MFHRFSLKEFLFLIILLTADYFYITTQHYWVNSMSLRFINLFAAVFVTLFVYFVVVKPERPYALALSLLFVLAVLMTAITIILHAGIRKDLSVKQVYIFLVLMSSVFLTAGIYSMITGIRKKK